MPSTYLQRWTEAKRAFETAAARKRTGMDVGKVASFFKKYKAHTGLSPVFTAMDKAHDAVQAKWDKASLADKKKLVALLTAAEEAAKTKGKAYMVVLKKDIENDMDEGGRDAAVRATENLSDTIEVLLKAAKIERKQREVELQGLEKGKGAGDAIKDSILSTGPQVLKKAIAGMKVMVRTAKADPTLATWMKVISGDPPTRWATTKLKDLGNAFRKYPELERSVGADPDEFQKKLNIYGAGNDESWWKKTLGEESKHKAEILKHVKAIESQIPNLEILAERLKDALKASGKY